MHVAYNRWKTKLDFTQLVSTDIKSVERGSFCLDLRIAKPCVCFEALRENILNYFLIIYFQAGQEAFRSITRSYYRYVFFKQGPIFYFSHSEEQLELCLSTTSRGETLSTTW